MVRRRRAATRRLAPPGRTPSLRSRRRRAAGAAGALGSRLSQLLLLPSLKQSIKHCCACRRRCSLLVADRYILETLAGLFPPLGQHDPRARRLKNAICAVLQKAPTGAHEGHPWSWDVLRSHLRDDSRFKEFNFDDAAPDAIIAALQRVTNIEQKLDLNGPSHRDPLLRARMKTVKGAVQAAIPLLSLTRAPSLTLRWTPSPPHPPHPSHLHPSHLHPP
jgi:hypothetical protein